MNDTFLPEGYKIPESHGNYHKWVEGDNTFRILSKSITGYIYWTKDKKPIRSPLEPKTTPNAQTNDKGEVVVKPFWAFIVYNYDAKTIQIMEITQKTIMNAIMSLYSNEKWGDPKLFDITVNRKGEGLETEYTVMPNPKEPLSEDIKSEFASRKITLEALYEGKDPFDPDVQITRWEDTDPLDDFDDSDIPV